MANTDINPFAPTSEIPQGIILTDSLDEYVSNKAATAKAAYNLKRMIGAGANHWSGKTWYAYGASLTQYGPYTNALRDMSGMTLVNKGLAGKGIMVGNHEVRNAIMNTTDGKTSADLITIEVMGNEMSLTFGDIADGINTDGTTPSNVYDTWIGCFVQCILYLQRNTRAQIVVMPFTDSRYQYQHPETPTTPNRKYNDGTTLADRRAIVERLCNMYGVYYIDPNTALGYAKKTDAYLTDQVHHTALGGYVVAEYLWSKIKDIPLWRTAVPT